jgi:hypothetical protein
LLNWARQAMADRKSSERADKRNSDHSLDKEAE